FSGAECLSDGLPFGRKAAKSTVPDILKGPILAIQEFYELAGRAIRNVARKPHYFDDILLQMESIGVGSLPIILLTGFFSGAMMAGRNSSGIASELGSMKVTEQIDAMRALGTDPIQKLVTPRMIATAVMLPCLTIIDDFVGMIGGNLMAYLLFAVPGRLYWSTVW